MTLKHTIAGLCAAATFTLAPNFAFAEDTAEQPEMTTRMYGSLGRASFDDAVQQEGIGSSALSWRFGLERQQGNWIYGGGLSGFSYDDRESFSQDVTSNWGDDSRADSTASSFNLYFEGGYSHPLNETVSLELLGGIELVASSSRSISNCTNCREEDIDVTSGPYIQPRVTFHLKNDWYWGASYNQYFGGDAKGSFMANVGLSF